MAYNIKSFYVKPDDVKELHIFQDKIKEDGFSSSSKVIMKMIKLYNKNKIKIELL